MSKLDEKGFVFLDGNSKPFLCRMWEGHSPEGIGVMVPAPEMSWRRLGGTRR